MVIKRETESRPETNLSSQFCRIKSGQLEHAVFLRQLIFRRHTKPPTSRAAQDAAPVVYFTKRFRIFKLGLTVEYKDLILYKIWLCKT